MSSSVCERRIQPSNCVVQSCEFTAKREPWFKFDSKEAEIFIPRLLEWIGPRAAVTPVNMEGPCSKTSLSTIAMMNFTKHALLLQYLTLCNDAELMKLELSHLSRELLFEVLTASRPTETICSTGESDGGHVLLENHLRITSRILEHDLLRYPHVNLSLYPRERSEEEFWKRNKKKAAVKEVKVKIDTARANLTRKYRKFQMFADKADFIALSVRQVRGIFIAFSSILLAIIAAEAAMFCAYY